MVKFTATDCLSAAQTDDLLALFHGEHWSKTRTAADVQAMLKHCHILGLIDADTGRLVAFARFVTDTVYRAMIFDVIVAREHRGSGLGATLVKTLLAHPLLASVERIELYCQRNNVGFYEKLGFGEAPQGTTLMRLKAGQAGR